MEKIIINVETRIEEAIFALHSNEIDKMVQIVDFDPTILFKNFKYSNCLLLQTIKIDNLMAFIKVNDLYEKYYSVFKSDYNYKKYNIDDILDFITDYDSINIFLYIVEKYSLDPNDLINIRKIKEKVFDENKFSFIEFFLINHRFRYKIKANLSLCFNEKDINKNINTSIEGQDNDIKLESDKFDNEDFIYFNCSNDSQKNEAFDISKYVTHNHKIVKSFFDKIVVNDSIKADSIKDIDFVFFPSMFQLGFIKCMKYLSIKYKSPYNPDFSQNSEDKIMKFMS